MSKGERGSEVVQAVVAVPLVLLVVFAVVQVGGMMLSVHRLSADLTRVSRQMDAAGLALAGDKEAFVKSELLGPASQLQPERLHVKDVKIEYEQVEERGGLSVSLESSALEGVSSSLAQRTGSARVSFDVAYDVPSLVVLPGLSDQTIKRHLVCTQVESRVVEVEVDER